MEAAHSWRIAWDKWPLIHPLRRAEMIAFILFKAEREGYTTEHFTKEKKTGATLEDLMKVMS